MPFEIEETNVGGVVVKVIGVGGAGGNAVNRMIQVGMLGVEFIVMNTDAKSLERSTATQKIVLGPKLLRGFGAGCDPEVGRAAAEESREEITAAIKGAGMVFITAGMGGGTGTGAAPVIAEIAKNQGILTVAVVTKPFEFEGRRKREIAEAGIAELRQHVDSIIVIPNERLKYISEERITYANAFIIADNVLRQAIQSISDIINVTDVISLDFSDVTRIMRDSGNAHIGVARASGRDKAIQAAEAAVASPLLETSINGATGLIINITSSADIDLYDIETASKKISDCAHPDALIIFGSGFDPELTDEIVITVIATGSREDALDIPDFVAMPNPVPQIPEPRQDKPEKSKVDTGVDEYDISELIGILNNKDNNFSSDN